MEQGTLRQWQSWERGNAHYQEDARKSYENWLSFYYAKHGEDASEPSFETFLAAWRLGRDDFADQF
jgi:hypothetical protein